ncbi:MAG: hypothetical protein R3F37_07860 [Candidatus Competibacteraceae bacterium]
MTINLIVRGLSGFAVLILASVVQLSVAEDAALKPVESVCRTVSSVEGEYHCAGECVVPSSDGGTELVEVTGEVDVIRKLQARKPAFTAAKSAAVTIFMKLRLAP